MSLTISTDVFCDGVDPDGRKCIDWTPGVTGPKPMARHAREAARSAGWVHDARDKKDYCPKHKGQKT